MVRYKKKSFFPALFSGISRRIKILQNVIKRNDKGFLLVVASLLCIGMFWVCSTTQIVQARINSENVLLFSKAKIINQLIALFIGIIAMFFVASADFEKTIKKYYYAVSVYIFFCVLLIITLFMPAAAGGRRWIPIPGIGLNIQTAEFAKIAIIFFIASYMSNRRNMADMRQNSSKVFNPFVLSGIGLALIALEPDIGIPALTFFGISCMMYVSGVSFGDILRVCLFAFPLFVLDCLRNLGHRLGRIQSFVLSVFTNDQQVDILGDAYQVSNSLIGICSGGITGRGIAHSHQKTHLLTQHESDFIFSVYAEETGLIGSLLLIGLFAALLYYCYKIAMQAKDSYYRSLAVGLSCMLGVQAFYSIAVNANFAPIKGIALPFISYGGSSLISTLIIIGIMMNVAARRE